MYFGRLFHQPVGTVSVSRYSSQRAMRAERVRLRQVGGQHVIQRRNIRAALDAAVTTQRHNATARPSDIAQQALDDRRGTDDLHAEGVMRPAYRVADRARPFAAGVAGDRLADPQERVLAGNR